MPDPGSLAPLLFSAGLRVPIFWPDARFSKHRDTSVAVQAVPAELGVG